MRTAKTLIRLGGCPCWSESSLGAQSLCWFCHVVAHYCEHMTKIKLVVLTCEWRTWCLGRLPFIIIFLFFNVLFYFISCNNSWAKTNLEACGIKMPLHLSLPSDALRKSPFLSILVVFPTHSSAYSPFCSFYCPLQNCRRHARGSLQSIWVSSPW